MKFIFSVYIYICVIYVEYLCCSFYLFISIDVVVVVVFGVFILVFKLLLKFKVNGGSFRENLVL